MRDAAEAAQRFGDRSVVDAGRACSSRSRGRIFTVVRSGDERFRRELIGAVELHVDRATGSRTETAGQDGYVRLGLILEQAQLGVAVGRERPVTVEMIRLEVEQDGDARPEPVHVFELKARQLADDPRVFFDRAVERRHRPADVAGDGDRAISRAEDRAEKLARRGLPVRAGHTDEGIGQEAEAELDLAPDLNAAGTRGRGQRRLTRHAGALDEQVDSLEQPILLRPEPDFDTGGGKPPGVDTGVAVDGEGWNAVPCEGQRRGLTGARQADDERAPGQLHGLRAVRNTCSTRLGTSRSSTKAVRRSTSSGANASRQRSSTVGRPGAPTWFR